MSDRPGLDLSTGLKAVIYDTEQQATYQEFKLVKRGTIHAAFTITTEIEPEQADFRVPIRNPLETVLLSIHGENVSSETRNPTWDQVLESIEEGQREYNAKGAQSRARALVRKGKPAAAILDALKELIPDEKGLSILKWGLSTIFKIWIRRIDNVERILVLLGDIPGQFSHAFETWQFYRTDTALHWFVKDYYETVVDSITKLLLILLRKQPTKSNGVADTSNGIFQAAAQKFASKVGTVARDVGNQVLNKDEGVISEVLSCLDASRTKLENRVEQLDRQQNIETNKTVRSSHRELQAMRKADSDNRAWLGGELKAIGDSIGQSRKLSDDDKAYIQKAMLMAAEKGAEQGALSVLQRIQSEFGRSRRGPRTISYMPRFYAEMIQSGLYDMTAEDEYKRREQYEQQMYLHLQQQAPTDSWAWEEEELPQPRRRPSPMEQRRTVALTSYQLLVILDVDPQLSIQDEERVLRESHSMPNEVLTRVGGLLSMPPFRTWLMSPQSSSLIVDGHCGDEAIGRTSAMSVFCASFAASLAQSHSFIVLDHFCGQNARLQQSSRAPVGPRGLMRSLISQLILYTTQTGPTPLEPVEENLYNGLVAHDPGAFCHLFEALLRGVGADKTVFCIIDGVSDFEVGWQGWERDISYVLQNLVRAVEMSGPAAARLKLLISSADQSKLLRNRRDIPRIELMAPEYNAEQVNGYGFRQDVQRMLQPMSPRGNMQSQLQLPRDDTHMLMSGNNRSQEDLRRSVLIAPPGVSTVQRVRSTSFLR